jgi:hypothetical protein
VSPRGKHPQQSATPAGSGAVRQLLLAGAGAVGFGLLASAPATAAPDNRTGQYQRGDGNDPGQDPRADWRDDRRGHAQDRRRSHYRRYPVGVPPPVYYPRYESPGIRLVFLIDIH